jgi:hypothetical protein
MLYDVTIDESNSHVAPTQFFTETQIEKKVKRPLPLPTSGKRKRAAIRKNRNKRNAMQEVELATTTADDADDEWVAAGGSEAESKSTVARKNPEESNLLACLFGKIATNDKMFWKLLPRFVCRLLLIKVGIDAAYAYHQDRSWILNSRSSRSPQYLEDGVTRLPTDREMCIATLVLGRDSSNKLTAVEHTTDRHDDRCIVSKVYTGRCSIHFQSPMSQLLWHRSRPTASVEKPMKGEKAGATDSKRVVITARCPLDPSTRMRPKPMSWFSTTGTTHRGEGI